MEILWIRHGQTPGNAERRYVGRTDEGLTADARLFLEKKRECVSESWKNEDGGKEQTGEVEQRLFMPDIIYVSPMLRCRETAEILFPGQEITVWDGFQETDFGDFEYKNYEELKTNPLYQAWIDSNGQMAIPNAESGRNFRERCCNAYERCIRDAREKGADRIAIVCHGGTIMSVMERYGEPKKSFYEWQISNGSGIFTETICDAETIENREEKRGVYYGIRKTGKWE